MIYSPNEPASPGPRGGHREVVLALLAMALLAAVMLRYTGDIWCDWLPSLCLPQLVQETESTAEPQDLRRPGSARRVEDLVPVLTPPPVDAAFEDVLDAEATETGGFVFPTSAAPLPVASDTPPAPSTPPVPIFPTRASASPTPRSTPSDEPEATDPSVDETASPTPSLEPGAYPAPSDSPEPDGYP